MNSNNASVLDNLSFLEISNNLIPQKFIWPKEEKNHVVTNDDDDDDLNEPIIDLANGDKESARLQVRSACLSHGLFQVINHGVDTKLLNSMQDHVKGFFNLPIDEKMKAQRLPGSFWGYSFAHADRFSFNLPWKETISCFSDQNGPGFDSHEAARFFESAFGEEFEHIRRIFREYSEAMRKLSLTIVEMLGVSLGVDPSYLKEYFEDGSAIMRCNFYPRCQEPGLVLGTGPHCDPTALTILHQDQIGGLQVLSDNKWKSVRPRPDALVVSLGDTFNALSNGVWKSCPHRAVVNKSKERLSLAFFLCPRADKVIVPPRDLLVSSSSSSSNSSSRMYPDFTWSDLLKFTQQHYRVDFATLQNFIAWLNST